MHWRIPRHLLSHFNTPETSATAQVQDARGFIVIGEYWGRVQTFVSSDREHGGHLVHAILLGLQMGAFSQLHSTLGKLWFIPDHMGTYTSLFGSHDILDRFQHGWVALPWNGCFGCDCVPLTTTFDRVVYGVQEWQSGRVGR